MEATTTGRFGGELSAVLYALSGVLLIVAGPLVPAIPAADRSATFAVGVVALASSVVIGVLPWHRWPRSSTLVLLPPTFALIALYNIAGGDDGFRYAPFFFVTFGWIGLVHRRGTSAAVVPLAAAAYLVPLALRDAWSATAAWSIVYVMPAGVLLGEATAWVSDRLHRTQQSLREQEAGFRKLFLENPQPMWVFDVEDYRFLEVNSAAIAHYGYTRREFLAMRVTDIRPADDLTPFVEEVAAVQDLHSSPVAWRHVLKDGRIIEVAITAHRLEFKGRPAMLSAIQDVTERNRLERELRHRAFHRRVDRARQPVAVRQPARARSRPAGPRRRRDRRDRPRPRRLQDRQRQPRPLGRRRAAVGGR